MVNNYQQFYQIKDNGNILSDRCIKKDDKYEGKGNIHIWITKILAFIHGFNPIKLDALFCVRK